MSKRGERKTGECAYCGKISEMTQEHVIPKCLFNLPLPKVMITIYACDSCNGSKSQNDGFFRDFLSLDLFGGNSVHAQTLIDRKILRAIRHGRSEIGRSILEATPTPLFSDGGIYLGDHPTLQIDEKRINEILSTTVRGLYYHLYKKRIPDTYRFAIRQYYPWDFNVMWDEHLYRQRWKTPLILGDVFRGLHCIEKDDPFTTFWVLVFFERVPFVVISADPAKVPQIEEA